MSGPISEIVLVWAEIILLVFGTAAGVLSLLLLFAPGLVRRWNERLGSYYDTDHTLRMLNTDVPTAPLLYRHAKVAGASLVLGSVVVLAFLFGRMDPSQFAAVFFASGKMSPVKEIVFRTVVIFAKLASLVGFGLGIGLLFAPDSVARLNDSMAKVLPIDPVFDQLNKSYRPVDRVFLRHSKIFGCIGLVASSALIWIVSKYLIH